MSAESPSSLGQILPLCNIVDERGLGIPMLWSVPRLPPGDAKTGRWKISWFFETHCRYFAMLLLEVIQVYILSFSLFSTLTVITSFFPPLSLSLFWRKVMKGNRVTRLRSLWFSLWSVKSYRAQLNLYIQAFGRVTAPKLSHMFQSFKLNSKRNRCLRQGFCSWKYVFVCMCFVRVHVPTSSSFCHIKTGHCGSGLFFFFFLFTEIFTVMDTSSFVGGNTVQYFVLLPDRNISESTQRFQSVIPEDSVTFQQAEWAPRLRPARGRGNIGRKEGREERREQSGDGTISDQVCET